MKVFLTGATGFLGRALVLALRRRGHEVVAWVRSLERSADLLGAEVCERLSMEAPPEELRRVLAGCEAVVHLAGAPVLSRWTRRRRAALVASRVGLTERLVGELARLERPPRVLVSASAVGYYGARGTERLDEESAPGSGFLAELCVHWERAALGAEASGVRCVLVRTGIVLGLDGGALPAMLPAFGLGLGGRLGDGRQVMPWIHVEDWVRLVLLALEDERVRGPLNAVAPHPVDNREFTRLLGAALGRRAPFPVPGFLLRGLLGGAASLLLQGQAPLPERATRLGFRFAFPRLESALEDLLAPEGVSFDPAAGIPDSAYLTRRPPAHQLSASTDLSTPPAETFAFFSDPANLGLLTPRSMGFHIERRSGAPDRDTTLDYSLRVGPLPLRWRTRFEDWRPPERFVDTQERGPYRSWWHEHRFVSRGAQGGTRMEDRVLYRLPAGPLGRLVHALFVRPELRRIFAHRRLAVRLRFGPEREVRLRKDSA